MPPSLEILRGVGLAETFIAHGVPVRVVEAYGRSRRLGGIDFSGRDDKFPFVLSLPQDRTEALLEAAVLADPSIRFLRGHRVTACAEGEAGVTVSGEDGASGNFHFTGRYALACDGGKSTVREVLGIPFDGVSDRCTFVMGDFVDTTGWGPQARFFLTPRGSVESFPLPDGKRRYVLRTPFFVQEGATDYLKTELMRRAGIDVGGARQFLDSAFRVQRCLARSFCSGRIFLCGDAAHLMSPVGGQNMNTGFADAEMATWLVRLLIEERVPLPLASGLYHRVRQRAGRAASWRAQRMMRVGTSGGWLWSAVRNGATFIVLHSPLRRFLVSSLRMQTIPFSNLAHCQPRFEQQLGLDTRPEVS